VSIETKSVRAPIARETDGLRILAARFRGRGLPKERYDIGMANLGPSESLLRDFRQGGITWRAFERAYREEMFEAGGADERNRTIKNRGQKFTLRLLQHLGRSEDITLLCHCAESERHCHRFTLQRLLARSLWPPVPGPARGTGALDSSYLSKS